MVDSYEAAAAAVRDPHLAPEVLADIAYRHEALRPAVAAHPNAYPALLEWLGALGDEAVAVVLAARQAPVVVPPPQAPVPSSPEPQVAEVAEVAAVHEVPPVDPLLPREEPRPGGRRPRWNRVGAGVAALAVVGLVVAVMVGLPRENPSPAPSASGASPTAPVVHEAEFCRDLDDPQRLDVTRTNYTESGDESVFEAARAACAADPDASFFDVYLEAVNSARFVSQLVGDFRVVDQDGYAFDLVVDLGIASVTADPSNEPPGFTAATRDLTLSMKVVNQTPERTLTFKETRGIVSPLSYPTFQVYAAFDAGSTVCETIYDNGRACLWPLAFGRMEDGFEVAAGGEYELTVRGGVPNGGSASVLLSGIPEASWDAVQGRLSDPDGYRIIYGGGDMSRFDSVCALPEASWTTSPYAPPVLVQTNTCP